MSRTLLIARREYVAYAKTIGFWMSLLIVPVMAAAGFMLPGLLDRASPERTVVVLDYSGRDLRAPVVAELDAAYERRVVQSLRMAAVSEIGPDRADAIRDAARANGVEAGLAELKRLAPRASAGWTRPRRDIAIVQGPSALTSAATVEAAEAAARPLLSEDATLPDGRELSAVALLTVQDGAPALRLWTRGVTDDTVEDALDEALTEVARRQSLTARGVDPAVVQAAEALDPRVDVFSPRAAGGAEVEARDRLPTLLGFVIGMLLWTTVLSGASILMNSVMEEKANRVLEVLLSSATTTQILAGKVLGVAGIAVTVMGTWGILGFALLSQGAPAFATDLFAGFDDPWLFAYLGAYFLGGYVMYATIFAAIGAFCETPRDAQTLFGPVFLLLAIPVVVMNFALRSPDLPIVKTLSWVPFFTPFLMSARAPADPPLWEIAGTIGLMAVTTIVVVWLGSKAFRAGALSNVKPDWKGLIALMRGRAGA